MVRPLLTVLVIGDRCAELRDLKISFATLGQDAEFIEVNCDGSSLEYFRDNKINAILFGLSKSEPNRVDLVEQLRSLNKNVALLVVTDIDDWKTWQRIIQTGAQCLVNHKQLSARQLALQTLQAIHQCEMQEGLRTEEMLMKQRAIFSATLTHDLKSPLSGSIRLLEGLLENKVQELSPDLREIITQLQNCNLVQLELIQDLLELYRLEDDKVPGETSTVELSDIVTACRQDLKAQADAKEIEIITTLEDHRVPLVFGDSGKLRRVIYNLLDNALKFGSSKSMVKVNFAHVDDMVKMEIEDRGPGIPLNELPDLFTRFQQGTAGRSMQFGSGLGLHLCKHIVEAHGGTITCDSVVDQGTRFLVYLPSAE